MNHFPESYTRGARLLKQLGQLSPGQNYRMPVEMLQDIEVPANPLDRQTPEFLAEWMHARMPFYCKLYRDPLGRYWEIQRPEKDAQ